MMSIKFQLTLAAFLAAYAAIVATEAIVFPNSHDPIRFTSRKLVRQVASEDYEASDYADKIIFLNKNQPTAFEQISAQNLQRFSIQVNKGTIFVVASHYILLTANHSNFRSPVVHLYWRCLWLIHTPEASLFLTSISQLNFYYA